MAGLYGNATGQINLDNALKNMNGKKKSNLDPKKKAKSKSKSDKQKDNDSKNSKSKSDSSSSGSDSKNNANDTSMAGIAFGGQMSAEIIRDVMNLFILNQSFASALDSGDSSSNGGVTSDNPTDSDNSKSSTKVDQGVGYDAEGHQNGAVSSLLYKYEINGEGVFSHVSDILKVAIPKDADEYINSGLNSYTQVTEDAQADMEAGHYGEVFNVDESMIPSPPQFLAYNGSILSMVNDLANRPFNELFFTHEEGVATLHYRQTPFEEDKWNELPKIVVTADEIISIDVTLSDQEQYSIFKLTSSTSQSNQTASEFLLPVTDDEEELVGRYGYKTMEKETQYFDNPTPSHGDGSDLNTSGLSNKTISGISNQDMTDDQQSSKFYPPYSTVLAYSDVEGLKNTAGQREWAKTYQIDNAYGGEALYNQISQVADQTNITSQQKAINIYNTSAQYSSANGINNPITESKAAEIANLSKQGQLDKFSYISMVLPDYASPFGGSQEGVGSTSGYLKNAQGRKEHPNKAAADIVTLSKGRIGSAQARAIIDAWNKNGSLSYADYNHVMSTVPHSAVNADVTSQISNGKSVSGSDMNQIYEKYQQRLFNWYADNSKFYSGEIKIIGRANVEFGKKLYFNDDRTPNSLWEFYIESVSHEFDYQSGWVTIIGVTRGLKVSYIGDDRRFHLFWGHTASFTGGFFGEPKVLDALTSAIAANSSGSGSDSGDSDAGDGTGPSVKGSKAAMAALKFAQKYADKGSVYSEAYHGSDFSTMSPPKGDCSSLVYFSYRDVGFKWGAGYALTTWGIASSDKVETVKGGSKEAVWNNLHKGDMVFWNTAGTDGHIGLYAGGGKCIAFNVNNGIETFNASPNSGYWWSNFSGHAVRAKS